jgi:1-acyl-sn-glycerol-3-phosphate acyltransferase
MYSAAAPFIMVSKTEVRSWPLIGWITAQAGTIYVERADVAGGQKQTHAEVNAQMAGAFRSGLPVLFFPEGTTTNSVEVLPFRRGLFHSVLADRVPMRAAALQYSFDQPNPGASIENDVCYWGDMIFGSHLFAFLRLRGVHTHIAFGNRDLEGQDRFTLSANAHEAVAELHSELSTRIQAGAAQRREHLLDRPVEAFSSFDDERRVRG